MASFGTTISTPNRTVKMVKVTYAFPGTQPPVFIAGSFTTPPWQPQEMQHTQLRPATAGHPPEYQFYKDLEVPVGEWQYKFRLGLGDWWALDEGAETTTDPAGNRNNLLRVEKSQNAPTKSSAPPQSRQGPVATEQDKTNVDFATHGQEVPSLIVEKVSNEPRHGDDLGPNATFSQKLAHERRAMDAEPDKVIISPEKEGGKDYVQETPSKRDVLSSAAPHAAATGAETTGAATRPEKAPAARKFGPSGVTAERLSSTPIPEVAATAAEVADVAATLDRTPEAGNSRLSSAIPGRISSTPISVVAATAAEVADVAATLDRTPISGNSRSPSVKPERLSDTPISQVADTAAEVADVAAFLDRTPESGASKPSSVKDEPIPRTLIQQAAARAAALANAPVRPETSEDTPPELTRMDRQRLSLVPVPDTVEQANEATDAISKEAEFARPPNGYPTIETPGADSGTNSPRVEHAPLFAHECLSPLDSKDSEQILKSKLGSSLHEESIEDDDLDDPLLEEFPTERAGILRRIRTLSTNLNEDQTLLPEGFPISPAHTSDTHPDDHTAPRSPGRDDHLSMLTPLTPQREDSLLPQKEDQIQRPPPSTASNERSSPLLSIAEEEDAPPLELPENALNAMAFGDEEQEITKGSVSKTKNGSEPNKVDCPEAEQDSEAGGRKRAETDGADEVSSPEANTAVSSESTLRQRKTTSNDTNDDASSNGDGAVLAPPNNKHVNIFQAVWRTVFVGWFGGFITRLCRGNRRA